MLHSAEIMLVHGEILATTPLAFQQYVKKYFEEKSFSGIQMFIAYRVRMKIKSDTSHTRVAKGLAPSVDVAEFTDGLPEGCVDVNDWIFKYANTTDGILILYRTWYDGQIESDCQFTDDYPHF